MTETAEINIDEIQQMLRDEEATEKYMKKNAFSDGLGKGEWKSDGKKGFRLTFPDGSQIRLKFFDTIKRIFNSKNVEVPGRESFLSYVDVVISPAGQKAYTFNMMMSQHVWAYSKGKRPAKETHAESIAKLIGFAHNIGIDLTDKDAWETYFAKHFPTKRG